MPWPEGGVGRVVPAESGRNLRARAPSMPEVVLASGDEASGLANMLGTLLAQNVERHPEKYRDFRKVNAAVVFDITDLGSAVTLSFSGDTCTVLEGAVGKPRVRLRTDSATLMGMSQVRIGALGLPNYLDPAGRAVLQAMAKGKLRIQGMRHLSTLNRVTRLFSVV